MGWDENGDGMKMEMGMGWVGVEMELRWGIEIELRFGVKMG